MYNVVIFQGLWGSLFSRFNGLEQRLRELPNVDYVTSVSWTNVRGAAALIGGFKDKTIPVCHSFGVGAFLDVARMLPKIDFDLMVSVDPSQYWGKGHELPKNVKRCINFWQDAPLWFIGNQQIKGAENVHINTSHVRIDDHPDVHNRIISEIKGAG